MDSGGFLSRNSTVAKRVPIRWFSGFPRTRGHLLRASVFRDERQAGRLRCGG
jgi:hypothetical protein